jgi:hypothetical protein
MTQDWTTADRLSDTLVTAVNAELAVMRRAGAIEPTQLLAGLCLAFLALERTAPAYQVDGAYGLAVAAIRALLAQLQEETTA